MVEYDVALMLPQCLCCGVREFRHAIEEQLALVFRQSFRLRVGKRRKSHETQIAIMLR